MLTPVNLKSRKVMNPPNKTVETARILNFKPSFLKEEKNDGPTCNPIP